MIEGLEAGGPIFIQAIRTTTKSVNIDQKGFTSSCRTPRQSNPTTTNIP